MTARIVQLAEAAVAYAATHGIQCARTYDPRADLPDLPTDEPELLILHVGEPETDRQTRTRNGGFDTQTVLQLAARMRVDPADNAACDKVQLAAEQFADALTGVDLDAASATFERRSTELLYDPQLLREKRVMLALRELTWSIAH